MLNFENKHSTWPSKNQVDLFILNALKEGQMS